MAFGELAGEHLEKGRHQVVLPGKVHGGDPSCHEGRRVEDSGTAVRTAGVVNQHAQCLLLLPVVPAF